MNIEFIRSRCGYIGNPLMWKFGFDLAAREMQAEIDALKARIAELRATLEAVVENADYLDDGHQIAIDAIAKIKTEIEPLKPISRCHENGLEDVQQD